MRAIVTTIRMDADLYEKLKLYVFSRKMLEPQTSMASVVGAAVRDYLSRERLTEKAK